MLRDSTQGLVNSKQAFHHRAMFLAVVVGLVNLKQPRVTREEGTLVEELFPSVG